MHINLQKACGQNNFGINNVNTIQTQSGLVNSGLQKDEFTHQSDSHIKKESLASKLSNFIIGQMKRKESNSETIEQPELVNIEEPLIDDKPLTVADRTKMIEDLELTKSDFESLSKQLSDCDDITFKRSVLLVKNGASFRAYQNFKQVTDLTDEQYKKAIEITKAGDEPFTIDRACKAANLDEHSYSRWLTFKEHKGTLYFYEENARPEKLAELDDNAFNNALELIPVLNSSAYIIPIVSDDAYYSKSQKIMDAGIFKEVTNYQEKYRILSNVCQEDEKTVDRITELLNNGLIIKESGDVVFATMKKFSELSDEQYNKALSLTKDYGVSYLYDIANIAELDGVNYSKAIELLNLNIPSNKVKMIASLNDASYNRVKNLIEKSVNPNTIGYGIDKLSCADFDKIDELANLGVKSFSKMFDAKDLDEEQFEKAKKLAVIGLPDYDFVKNAKLSDSDFEKELNKIKNIASGLKFDDGIETEEELYKFSDDELEDIKNKLEASGVYIPSSEQNSISTLAYLWRTKYITGINALPKYDSQLIPYALDRYVSKDCAPLGRWMRVENLAEYIEQFPDIGEIYQSDNIMSFAKTLNGAEVYRGNNFSDSNTSMNVKFVLYPKNEITQAYDIGEGKYGDDEVLYKANQQFKVLYKDVEELGSHNLYTIYLQEV